MEDSVMVGSEFGQLNNAITVDHSSLECDNSDMELNLADTLLELDSEDIADIYSMVSDWEFNFGSLEGSDTEELLALVQLENQQQFSNASSNPHPVVVAASPVSPNVDWKPTTSMGNDHHELHDRLPGYYTALAPSRCAPWIHSGGQVINKLPAYITDVTSLDMDGLSSGLSEGEQRPGKKKLNLAEYRTRRERQLRQQQEIGIVEIKEEAEVKVKKEDSHQIKDNDRGNIDRKSEVKDTQPGRDTRANVSGVDEGSDSDGCSAKKIKLEEGVSSSSESANDAQRSSSSASGKANSSSNSSNSHSPPCRRDSQRSRRKSSRSPTRSYSSRSSRSRSPSPAQRRRRRRSSSRSSRSSYSSSRSRSRSPSPRSRRRRASRSRSRSWRRNRSYSQRRSRSPSPKCRYSDRRRVPYDYREAERKRQIEERRVIYVGKIAEGTTRADLRRRFEVFGPVVDVSLHFRDRGDNYGFVTFAYKVDAYEAVEHGNDDPNLPKYDLSFGGRRAFCKEQYADLDAVDEDRGPKASDVDFETLLRAVQAQLHRRPCS